MARSSDDLLSPARFLGTVAGIVVLDQFTKLLAVDRLTPAYTPHPVLGEWFRLTLVFNKGAAFGLSLGPWSRPLLKGLAAMKSIRGTALDFFGYAHLRREERALIPWYEEMIRELLPGLTPANLAAVVEIASLPDRIRGYEQIKFGSIKAAREAATEMRTRLLRPVAA